MKFPKSPLLTTIKSNINFFILCFVVLFILASCTEKEPKPYTDIRDAVVGRYEAVDSLFKYGPGTTDSIGSPHSDFVGVFLYPVVELRKGEVFNDRWGRNEPGYTYRILERDTSCIGKNGERTGQMGRDIDFLESSSGTNVRLHWNNHSMFHSIQGEVVNNQLVFVNHDWPDFFSIANLKRL